MEFKLHTTVRELKRMADDLERKGVDAGEGLMIDLGSQIIIVRSVKNGYIASYSHSCVSVDGSKPAAENQQSKE